MNKGHDLASVQPWVVVDPLCNLVFESCYGVQIMHIFFNLDEEIWLIFSPSMLLYSMVLNFEYYMQNIVLIGLTS